MFTYDDNYVGKQTSSNIVGCCTHLHFILPPKSFKCSKYKNIQESGYCSKLHLLLNNNKVLIYKKHNIYYPEYCYKMKIFTIYLGGVVVV